MPTKETEEQTEMGYLGTDGRREGGSSRRMDGSIAPGVGGRDERMGGRDGARRW